MLSVITIEENSRWNKIVSSFQDFDTYYLNGYVRAFKLHGDGEPYLFYYEGEGVRGINVVMKRDIAKDDYFQSKIPEGRYFDFATPYGYGGWLVEGEENQRGLFSEYSKWCCENGIVSEFVRFHPLAKNHLNLAGEYETVPLGETVAMDLRTSEGIWNNIVSQNRNKVRKAIKNNVKIYNGRYPEIYEKFRNIYDQTMNKDHADKYYYFSSQFYKSILEDLPQNAQVFYAQIPDGTVIAASIMLAANKRMNYHLSGSLREYANLAPTNLLLYQAALWGNANGYKTLYLGGGVGSGEDSLFQFKRAFYKGELNRFYIGKKIFQQDAYKELLQIRGEKDLDNNYFPVYRAKKYS